MAEPQLPRIEVVEEVESVPVPVRVEQRLSFLSEHLGMSRNEVAGKLLEMVFREGVDWEDIEYLRTLTDGIVDEADAAVNRTP
jgi:hypothetical protein